MSHAGRTDPEGVAKHAEEKAAKAKRAKPEPKPAAKQDKKARKRSEKPSDDE